MYYDEFVRLVSFCILMEANGGILGKSPDYVLEKYETRDPASLDLQNEDKLQRYLALWRGYLPPMEGQDGH